MSEPTDRGLFVTAALLVEQIREADNLRKQVYPALREFGAGLTLSEAVSIIEGLSIRPDSSDSLSPAGLLLDEMRVLVKQAKSLGFGAG